jgi:outer membrane protein OmpA-like peptidoglycan-associated protein
MRKIVTALLSLLFALPLHAAKKERITEQGSSLFYRSWRYPVEKEEVKEEEKEQSEADSSLTINSDTLDTPLPDSISPNTDILNAEPDLMAQSEENKENATTQTDKQKATDSAVEKESESTPAPCVLYFKFDQSNYISDYTEEIDTLLKFIAHYPNEKFILTAHTDERGSISYNQKLSERRAQQLFRTLVQKGIDPTRLECVGRSELEPAIPNAKNERDHQKNRRVEISIKK